MDEIGGDPGAPPLSGGLMSLLDKGDLLLERVQSKIPYWEQAHFAPALSARGLLLAFVGLLLLLFLPPLMERLLRRFRHVQVNFRGDSIPQSFGLVILLWSGVMLWFSASLLPAMRETVLPYLVAIVGFGLLGLLDDVRGDKKIQGLRGHFRAALQERTITTGFVKAVSGGVLALWIGYHLFPYEVPRFLLAAALIALSANAVNLLDLRPGRAGAVFLLSAVLLVWAAFTQRDNPVIPPLLYVILPAFVVWERDARARVMLGDAGSNPLGATLGLATAQYLPLLVQVLLLFALIAMHLLAERLSLTKLIESNRILRSLDRLTGVR